MEYYASTEMPGRRRRALDLAIAWAGKAADKSTGDGARELVKLEIPANHPGPGDHLGLPEAFGATPEHLIESWRVAQRIDASTEPGDTIYIVDRDGIAGVLATEQAMRRRDRRRRVVVVAGESTYLRFRSEAGVAEGLSAEDTSSVDWELASYRWADAVVTPSAWVAEELALVGVGAQLMEVGRSVSPSPIAFEQVWLPEPIVRPSRIGSLLRAVNTAVGGDAKVYLSDQDGADGVWTGTTWEALDGIRLVHQSELIRSEPPDEPTLILLGDRTAVPSTEVQRLIEAGTPAVVPEGSTVAGMYPDLPTWGAASELADQLAHPRVRPDMTARARSVELPEPPEDIERARNVSVGIPIFRDVRFLEECVESILSQTQAPFEVMLYDDGSNLDTVDALLDGLARSDDRIRVLSGPNQGVCVARNEMLELMGGNAFLFVDADDVLEPTFIRQTADALRANEALAAVATWTRFFGTYEAVEAKPPFDRRTGQVENPIISTCALVDMSVRDRGVRFAPDLAWLFCEDWHFWAQIVAAGGEFGLVPEPLARHRVHSSGGHRRTELAYNLGRARAVDLLR